MYPRLPLMPWPHEDVVLCVVLWHRQPFSFATSFKLLIQLVLCSKPTYFHKSTKEPKDCWIFNIHRQHATVTKSTWNTTPTRGWGRRRLEDEARLIAGPRRCQAGGFVPSLRKGGRVRSKQHELALLLAHLPTATASASRFYNTPNERAGDGEQRLSVCLDGGNGFRQVVSWS